ncbi:MAG: TetR family transcriptional regulator [Janthinobacterium svalbardensis]|uniref:TetR family transcriptional regulator n=1 Tax=Janthinobacterium svalbardensis TaxID=368607 RepID=A0A290WS82_9BURK|nr:TetR family transcriptional regulator [Janthinobacterium svalbardensis]ATD59759.1 TetR family transcriptional regulator [Janthinobacterium svalbardensis]
MRTSKAQQAKNHRLIIQTAVDLMTQHGFEGTTMKQIARAADVGDATIYKYFPTKEKLVTAYFQQAIADAVAQADKTQGQNEFSLQERLQLVVESLLEGLLADREFVGLARGMVERAPTLLLGEQLPGKPLLQKTFLQMLEQAETTGEIAPCGFKPSLSGLLADYVYGVIAYWLRDTSDQFSNTTQMVDLSLGVLVLALRSGLVDKLLELGGFMVRSQLARLMQDGNGLLDLLQLARRGLGGVRS